MEFAFGIVGILLGIGVVWNRASLVLNLLKEVSDVLVAVTESLGDQKLSAEEWEKIKKEAIEVSAAAKALVGKK